MAAVIERDPEFRDRSAGIGDSGFSVGAGDICTCSTQMVPYQRMQFFGTKGRIEIEIPFNAPPDRADANFYR